MEHDLIIIGSNNEVGQKGKLTPRWMSRAVQKARQEIMAQEDAAIFKALDDAVFSWKDAESGNKDI